MDEIVVVAGGSVPSARAAEAIPRGARAIAANGGADHALALGLDVDLAIGDFDSVTPDGLAAAAHVERHPVDKDATDLELALRAAVARRPERILVVGGSEGRLDHLLGEFLILGADWLAGVEVDAVLGDALIHVIHEERGLRGDEGELISLFALNGAASGITTEGLAYALRGETLLPGSSRGISNRFAASQARITLGSGVLLAVRP